VRTVLQRVTSARVDVGGDVVGEITRPGLVALVGVTHGDGSEQVGRTARKIAELRILREEQAVVDIGAPVLVVSQFTLYGDAHKGRRPSWTAAAPGPVAEPLVQALVDALRDGNFRGRHDGFHGERRSAHPHRRRLTRSGRTPVGPPRTRLVSMAIFGSIQSTLMLLLGVLALGCEVFALLDVLRHRPDAFVAAGKRTKTFWTIVLAVALAIGVIFVLNVLNFIGIIAFVAAAVYLVDVRPALRQVSGRGRSKQGPYGPW